MSGGFSNKGPRGTGGGLSAGEILWTQTGNAGVVLLAEQGSAPSATAGVGKLYVKSSDSLLYFKDDSGNEYSVGGGEVPLTFSTGLVRTTNTITVKLATGFAGGQSVIGGTASGENLTLSSTTNATKGYVLSDSNFRFTINDAKLYGRGTTESWMQLYNSSTGDMTFHSTFGSGAILFNTADSTTSKVKIAASGNVGIGQLTPTAVLHLKAGTATASTAPIKLTTGTALTTPEDGAMEYHTSHLYFTIGSTRFQLDNDGVLNTNYAAKTTAYTITSSDGAIEGTSGPYTITLPTAVGISGRNYTVKNSGDVSLTVDANGSELIDDALNVVLTPQTVMELISTGANWTTKISDSYLHPHANLFANPVFDEPLAGWTEQYGGTIDRAPSLGKFGSKKNPVAITLDGAANRMSVPHSTFGTSAYSISFRYKTDQLMQDNDTWFQNTGISYGRQGANDIQAYAYLNASADFAGPRALRFGNMTDATPDSAWHTRTLVFYVHTDNKAHCEEYQDGVLLQTATTNFTGSTDVPGTTFGIGGVVGSASFGFKGSMSRVQFFNRRLTSAEVITLQSTQFSVRPDGEWLLNDGVGTTLANTALSGGGGAGTLISGTWATDSALYEKAAMRCTTAASTSGGYAGSASKYVYNLKIGKEYKISLYARTLTGTASHNLFLTEANSSSPSTTLTTSWQRIETSFIASGTSFQLYTRCSTTSITYFVDGLQVTEIPTSVIEAGSSQKRIAVTVGASNADFITNGVHDGLVFIAAVAYLATLGGGKLIVKNGTYYWDDYTDRLFVTTSNITIEGESFGGVTLVARGSTFSGGSNAFGRYGILCVGVTQTAKISNIVIRNLVIDCNGKDKTAGITFDGGASLTGVIGLQNVICENVRVYNQGGASVGSVEAAAFIISGNTQAFGADKGYVDNIKFYNCEFDTSYSSSFGIMGGYVSNLTMDRCQFHDAYTNGLWYYNYDGSATSYNWDIVYCRFEDNMQSATTLTGSMGNYRDDNQNGVDNLNFDHCYFGPVFNPAAHQAYDLTPYQGKNLRITDCLFDRSGGGISLGASISGAYGAIFPITRSYIARNIWYQTEGTFDADSEIFGLLEDNIFYEVRYRKIIFGYSRHYPRIIRGNLIYNCMTDQDNTDVSIPEYEKAAMSLGGDGMMVSDNYIIDDRKLNTPTSTPTSTTTVSGALGARTYYCKFTYANATGETMASAQRTQAIAANSLFQFTGTGDGYIPGGAKTLKIYASTVSGSETLQTTLTLPRSTFTWTEPVSGLVAGAALPGSNTTHVQTVYGIAEFAGGAAGMLPSVYKNNTIIGVTTPFVEDTSYKRARFGNIYIDTVTREATRIDGVFEAYTSKTANYTATTSDHVILCDATSGAVTVTLPPVASRPGQILVIKKTDSSINVVTLDGNASETIDGAATISLGIQYASYKIMNQGTAWFVI